MRASRSSAARDDIRALVEAGRSQAAYDACAATDTSVASDLDLWCGIAAVDVGRAGVGLLALERYSLTHPDDVRARLELARAYFYAGDDRRARTEFEAVLATQPPRAVRAGIERYLDALTAREADYTTRVTGYLEVGAGYDSNANGGVAQSDIGLPVLGAVTVIDAGVRKHDGFGFLGGAVQINHPVRPGLAVFASAWGNGTFYGDVSQFDLATLGVAAGGRYQSGRDLYGLTYAHAETLLDHDRFRRSDGVGFEWRRQVSELSAVSVAPQFARLSYTDENAARDADFAALALGYRRWWLSDWQPVLNVIAYGGDEHNRARCAVPGALAVRHRRRRHALAVGLLGAHGGHRLPAQRLRWRLSRSSPRPARTTMSRSTSARATSSRGTGPFDSTISTRATTRTSRCSTTTATSSR